MAKKKVVKTKTKHKKNTRSMSRPALAIDHYPEVDARTLAEASVIKADKGRLGKAKKASVKLIKERQAELDGLKKVLKGSQ